MSTVINLNQFRDKRRKKDEEESRTTGIKQAMRDSLSNEEVMRRYRIQTKDKKQPTHDERLQNIRDSIRRINNLMQEIKDNQPEDKTK